MKRADNSKKGFTMVELVVAFAISGVLFASLISVLAPVYGTYQRTRAQADALLIAGNVIDSIRTTANIATELSETGDTICIGNRIVYSVDAASGMLMYSLDGEAPKPVFDAKYYDGKRIALDAEETDPLLNIITVTVTVQSVNAPDATVTAIISPLRNVLS